MKSKSRLARAALKAVRTVAAWAPLVAATLGLALPARAAISSSLNIDVNFTGIGPISDLTAVAGGSTTINLSWTEPFHASGSAPFSYDVRASSIAQIVDDTVFSTSSLLSAFSTSVPPAPGSGGGAAGFTVTGLQTNVTYYFAIREKDSGVLHGTWLRTVVPARNVANFAYPLPGAPNPVAAGSFLEVDRSSVTASWAVSAAATNYMLIASTVNANPPLSIAGSSSTAASTGTIAGLGPNATYFFFVSACGIGCSPYTAIGSTVTLAAPAVALSSASVSSGTFVLSWGANGDPAGTLYRVAQSTDGVTFSTVAATTSTSAVIGGLLGASTYYFQTIAYNFGGTPAAASSSITVVTLPGPPAVPTAGAATGVFLSSISFNWASSLGATDYVLVASTNSAVPPSPIAASSTTVASTATLTALAPNTTYFVFASACANGCSPFAPFGSTVTLAAQAVGLSTTSLSSSTVSLAWGANGNPAGTGYQVLISTDGISYAVSLVTNVPAATVGGLTAGGTYFFEVVALNGSGIAAAPSAALTVATPAGPIPSAPTGLTAVGRLQGASITWSPLPVAQQGVGLQAYLLFRSTNAGFGFVQIATTTGVSYLDQPLLAGVTVYYRLIAKATDGAQSAPSATVSAVPYTVLPMEPLGVTVSATSSTVTMKWSPTTRFFEGTPFLSTGTPIADELKGYSVWRSTNICDPSYVLVSSMPITQTSLTDNNNGLNYYYRLFSFNSAGISTNVVTVSALGQHNYFVDDCVTNMVLEDSLAASLNGATNGLGDIRITRNRRPQDLGNGVFQSVEWHAVLNGATELKNWTLPKPARFVLHFDLSNGQVVPATAPTNGFSPLASGAAASGGSVTDLGTYWYNGVQFLKMYGTIDPVAQTVSVDSPNLGTYQIRSLARANGAVFDLSNLSARVITPNEDGLNDTLIFTYDPGPKGVVPVGKIFDLRGTVVADMVPGLVPNTLTWNGRMNGMPVHSGVYVYRITGDGKTFTGTIVVAR